MVKRVTKVTQLFGYGLSRKSSGAESSTVLKCSGDRLTLGYSQGQQGFKICLFYVVLSGTHFANHAGLELIEICFTLSLAYWG